MLRLVILSESLGDFPLIALGIFPSVEFIRPACPMYKIFDRQYLSVIKIWILLLLIIRIFKSKQIERLRGAYLEQGQDPFILDVRF